MPLSKDARKYRKQVDELKEEVERLNVRWPGPLRVTLCAARRQSTRACLCVCRCW